MHAMKQVEDRVEIQAHMRRGSLTDREKDVLTRRFGIDCRKETLDEVAESYNVTPTRIRQIQWKAIRKIIRKAVR